ncbi:hypothetical protein BDW42DRAFT_111629 [Aspergillus taichungensis]|uniref:Uncharacterized protein n=1 Tax=Aspergillus taichungensis TaxID=482145 RepID=A0A2J5HTJ9_9EURO|nr:hypothetical protein BDW42DRAFT_111629 [Aspergillus taichungensis]
MAPNQRIVSGRPQKGFFRNVYDEATNPEHATIVRSILVFGVCPLLSFFFFFFFFLREIKIIRNNTICSSADILHIGRCCFPPQQPGRAPPSSVSRHPHNH